MNRTKIITTSSYYASFVAMGISMSALGPTLPALASGTHSSLSEISVLFTARALGGLLGSMGGGGLYDRLRGHRVMALAIVLMAIFTALTPFVPVLWLLTGLLFITGAVQGVLNIGGNAQLVWVHREQVSPFMNGLHFCFGIGTFLAPVIVAQFITRGGGLIWTYLLLAVLILPTAYMAFLPSPAAPKAARQAGGEKLDIPLIVLIALVFGCYGGASGAFGGWVYTYALNMKLADATNAAYLTSLFWGGLTVGRLVAIPIAFRFKPQKILWADFIGAVVSLLAMLIWPTSLAAVLVTSAAFGFALASIYPTTMSLSGRLMTLSGKVTGWFSIGSNIGGMIIPWLIGQFFESSGPQSMTVILLVDMLAALGVLALLRKMPVTRPAVEKTSA